jgi:Secretion system C-terminal sorting domain
MKQFILLALLFTTFSVYAQPTIDYETVGQNWVYTIFSNGPSQDTTDYAVVSNPNSSGINTSSMVGKYLVRADGDPWSGIFTDAITPFTLTSGNSHITVMVYKDVISPFNLKLEGFAGAHDNNVPNTVTNQWEQLVFDYSADIGKMVTRLTIIPDFPATRTAGSTNYFDNIDFSGTLVPVELTSFTGNYAGNNAQLKWSTATELNNQGFDIQRSIAGSDFVTIAFIQGKGTTTQSNSYSFIDKAISPSTIYSYRLKQIDFDGSYAYSNIVNLGKSLPLNFELSQNFPNPFNPSTKISFSLPVNSNVSLDIYNLVGEKVMTVLNGELEAGNHDYDINGSRLASGIYVYRLTAIGENGTNFTSSKKMTLLK